MKRNFLAVLILCVVILSVGCTVKRGTISLSTTPSGAEVYLDGIQQGTTPLDFEWDASRASVLKIEMEGYNTETEMLNKAWMRQENRKGGFVKEYVGAGDAQKRIWRIRTFRELKENRKEF